MIAFLLIVAGLLGAAIISRVGTRFTDWLIPRRLNFHVAVYLARFARFVARGRAARAEAEDALANAAADLELAKIPPGVHPIAGVLPVFGRSLATSARKLLQRAAAAAASDQRGIALTAAMLLVVGLTGALAAIAFAFVVTNTTVTSAIATIASGALFVLVSYALRRGRWSGQRLRRLTKGHRDG